MIGEKVNVYSFVVAIFVQTSSHLRTTSCRKFNKYKLIVSHNFLYWLKLVVSNPKIVILKLKEESELEREFSRAQSSSFSGKSGTRSNFSKPNLSDSRFWKKKENENKGRK